MKYFGIILAGGVGSRMNCKVPKQYMIVEDKEIVSFSIDAFRLSVLGEDFVVVADSSEHRDYLIGKYGVKSILGGKTRNESFYNALQYIEQLGGCDAIFVNEAARPMIYPELVNTFLSKIGEAKCVYCTKTITDSLETAECGFADRECYRLVMSPEAYDFETIQKYFSPDSVTTFPGHDIPLDMMREQYTEYKNNIKITYNSDLLLFEFLLNNRRAGNGL